MATVEELNILRNIRRLFGKRPVDCTRMELSINKGTIYIQGSITPFRDEIGVIAKTELNEVVGLIYKIPGVKAVVIGCKVIETKKKEITHAPTL